MRALIPAAALFFASPAVASADVTVRAVDISNTWSQSQVKIKAGETVSWSFTGTITQHNVQSKSPNWDLKSDLVIAGPARSYTFKAPGIYTFICFLHESTMSGQVEVSDATGAPPPAAPPPPLSEQPFANDTPPLTSVERRDTVAPTLDRVKASRVARGVRVRFRLSEGGKVAIKLTRGKRVVRTRTVEVAKGTRSVTLRGLKAGSYRVQVSAKDLAGNAAKAAPRATVTVRG